MDLYLSLSSKNKFNKKLSVYNAKKRTVKVTNNEK